MRGEINALMSTAMDVSDNYPVGRSSCFDIGISGNCPGNCLICKEFIDDCGKSVAELDKRHGMVIENLQELVDLGLIDFAAISGDYIEIKDE